MSWTATLPQRFRASGIHFLLSLLVFLALLFFILYRWYPQPFFSTDGGWQGVRIMIGVDLVLGPLLTFLIFNSNKKRREIVIDLSVIALIQVSAIIWGIYAVHGQRPVAIVHWENSFYSVKAEELAKQDVALESLKQFSDATPPVIYARMPSGPEEVTQTLSLAMNKALGEWALFHLYSPVNDNLDKIAQRALDIHEFSSGNAEGRDQLETFLAGEQAAIDDFIYVRFIGSYKSAVLVLDKQGRVVESLSY